MRQHGTFAQSGRTTRHTVAARQHSGTPFGTSWEIQLIKAGQSGGSHRGSLLSWCSGWFERVVGSTPLGCQTHTGSHRRPLDWRLATRRYEGSALALAFPRFSLGTHPFGPRTAGLFGRGVATVSAQRGRCKCLAFCLQCCLERNIIESHIGVGRLSAIRHWPFGLWVRLHDVG